MDRRTLGRTAYWTELGLAAMTVALALVMLAAAGPILLGYQSYVVTSGSMEPAIATGSTVVDERVKVTALRPGDIVTYVARGDRIITHRIVAITNDENGPAITTKGDANRVADPELVRAPNVLGRVRYSVPLSGYAIAYVNDYHLQPYILLLMVIVAGFHFGLRPRLGRRSLPTDAPILAPSPPAPAEVSSATPETVNLTSSRSS